MDKGEKIGFVTFADILGWKGIWRDQNKVNPIQMLLKIKEQLDDAKEKELINILKNKVGSIHYDYEVKGTDRHITDLSKLKENITVFLKGKSKDREAIEIFFNENEITVEIELISDTFVITSSSNNRIEELILHAKLNLYLISCCLDNKLLIRGATSYGVYVKEKMVYVGPAIDEAAAWHEQGEEVGIFLTPSAYLNFKDNSIDSVLELRKPNLKVSNFETFVVDWRSCKDKFVSIAKNESPILPDISKKFTNTIDYLTSKRKKIDV